MGTEGRPTRAAKWARYGATNRSSSKKASIRESSSDRRLASSGRIASHTVTWGSDTRSTSTPPGVGNYIGVILPPAKGSPRAFALLRAYFSLDFFGRK